MFMHLIEADFQTRHIQSGFATLYMPGADVTDEMVYSCEARIYSFEFSRSNFKSCEDYLSEVSTNFM